MGKIRAGSLRSSMTITFLMTICVIAVLSAVTIFASNRLQQEILRKRYLTISSPEFQIDENTGNYVFDIENNNAAFQPLSTRDHIIYYGSYAAMIGLSWLVLEWLQRYITGRNFGFPLCSCRMEWKRYRKTILIFIWNTVEMMS